jgi:hypothetical protein
MLFWVRELLGWLLIVSGVFCFYMAIGVVMTEGPLLLEGAYAFGVGFVIFRGGLTVLKVSMAGRICLESQKVPAEPTVQGRMIGSR